LCSDTYLKICHDDLSETFRKVRLAISGRETSEREFRQNCPTFGIGLSELSA
jgi:hypothetical protein